MKKISVTIAVFFMLSLVFGCMNANTEGIAPDFEAKAVDGTTVKLSNHSGKVILLNFFATWCAPCRNEMPDFNEIAREYRGRVEVITVNVGNENISKIRDFVKRNNLRFKIIVDNGRLAALYGPIRAIPVTYIIDKDFNIVKKLVGARSKAQFVKDIEGLL